MNGKIISQERIDDLGINGYRILQDPDRFCFGIDAVLLAHFAKPKKNAAIVDFCTGTGIIPILMEPRCEAKHFYALEIQEESADMAKRSVSLNHLEEKITVMTADVREASKIFTKGTIDMITCNPPYMIANHGLINPESPKAIARHEVLCTLEDIIREAALLLRQQGSLCLVHRPFRLAEIISLLVKYKLEPKQMRLVYPYVDKEPNMVLIQAVKGGKSRITVDKPLIVYEAPGIYTKEVREMYGGNENEQ